MPSPLCGVVLGIAKCFGCHEDGTGPCSEAIPPVVRRECGNLASVVWNSTLGGLVNVLCLCCNADRLKDNMRTLMAEKQDVMRRAADAAEKQGGECWSVVKTWEERVNELNDKVEELQKSVHSCTVVVKFPCLSYSVKGYLDRVEELRREMTGNSFRELVGPAPPPARVSQFTSSTIHPDDPSIGEARQHLANDQIGVVGVMGAAGIGKTALLQALNNEPFPPGVHGFDVVIWISLSANPTVEELQAEIGRRLGVSLSAEEAADEKSRARALNRALSRRRFLLLLDDVRDPGILRNIFDRVGIPDLRPKKSKIVFATASSEIARLGDRELVLGSLGPEQSWEVFYKNVSEKAKKAVTQDPGMKAIAEDIVGLCDGSPSALINVARDISGAHPSLDQWEIILDAWSNLVDRFPGTEPILRSLRLTYDLLPSDALRTCFLYCSLFPERSGIDKIQLVEYWVGEGLLDTGKKSDRIEMVRNRGSAYIRDLTGVFLLCDRGKTVVLPESARRLAVNLTSEGSGGGKKFVVFAGKGCLEVRGVESWSDAERVSLMQNDIRRLPDSTPECRNLRTFFINDNPRLEIDATDSPNLLASSSSSPAAAAFIATNSTSLASSSSAASSSSSPIVVHNNQRPLFQFMTGLRVLDLSSTSIRQLPSDIRLLGELMYLNLSNTKITDLPEGLGGLMKLRQLNLRGTKELKQIPHETISRLGELQALNLYEGGYYLCFGDEAEHQGWARLLGELKKLDELGVNMQTPFPWRTLPEAFVRFQSCARFLKIAGPEKDSSTTEGQVLFDVCQFPILEVLQLSSLPFSCVMAVGGAGTSSRRPLQKLRHLLLSRCDEREDLEWVRKLLPCLAIYRS